MKALRLRHEHIRLAPGLAPDRHQVVTRSAATSPWANAPKPRTRSKPGLGSGWRRRGAGRPRAVLTSGGHRWLWGGVGRAMPSAASGSGAPRHRSGSLPIQGTPPPITRSSLVALRAPGSNRTRRHGRLPNARSHARSTVATRVHAPAGRRRWMKLVAPAGTRARAVAAGGLCSDDAAPFCHTGTERSPAMASRAVGAA
jgi:hypothetical protein